VRPKGGSYDLVICRNQDEINEAMKMPIDEHGSCTIYTEDGRRLGVASWCPIVKSNEILTIKAEFEVSTLKQEDK
jgi:hypothetical protein